MKNNESNNEKYLLDRNKGFCHFPSLLSTENCLRPDNR